MIPKLLKSGADADTFRSGGLHTVVEAVIKANAAALSPKQLELTRRAMREVPTVQARHFLDGIQNQGGKVPLNAGQVLGDSVVALGVLRRAIEEAAAILKVDLVAGPPSP